jgi:hypothetical protein
MVKSDAGHRLGWRSHEIDMIAGGYWFIAERTCQESLAIAKQLEGDRLMKPDGSSRTYLRYGRTLVKSGVSGLRSGRESHLNGQPLSESLTQSARASLSLATVGACAGLLRFYVRGRRGRVPKTIAWSAIGSAIGFCAGFAWKTRELTASMGRSSLKQMGVVRDEHWLQRHPIDYA